ncbi:MAG: DUF4279 domain-containing protein [Pseudomonadota bacterium]
MINPDLAIYLAITGYGDDPAPVNAALDLAPSVVWVRDEPFSTEFPDARRLRSQWMLASGLPADALFRDHCAALLALLEPRADRLRMAARQWHVSLVVGRFYHHGDPALYLEPETVQRFAALGLDASFDQLAHAPGHGTPLYRDPPAGNDAPEEQDT